MPVPSELSDRLQLPFSEKYDRAHAEAYFRKHRAGLMRRLSNRIEIRLARRALNIAGAPTLVLDLPCGAGRFWPVLAEHPGRVILAADNSADMVEVAKSVQPADIVARVKTFQTSAFEIGLPDRAVDSLFCMRLMHHIGESEHRLAMLREFHRVSRETVIVSLWVDRNYMAWKRRRLEQRRESRGDKAYQNRFVLPAVQVEREFAEAGFDIEARLDFLPFYSMWRVYVLRKCDA